MNKINWGFIGASTIAKEWMVKAVKDSGQAEVVAVMSSKQSRAEKFAKENKIKNAYSRLTDFLNCPEIDAVYISTTNELHLEQTLACANAGKHVLCEKPLALSLKDARKMIDTCRDKGVIMGTNHHLRCSNTHRTVRDLIQSGKIGEPVAMRIFHAVYLPPHLQSWRIKSPEAGGGVALDITVHDADTLRFVLGEEVKKVSAMKQNQGMAENGLEDGMVSILETTKNTQVMMHESFAIQHAGTGFEVHGTEGSIKAEGVMTQQPTGSIRRIHPQGEEVIPVQHVSLYGNSIGDFQRAIRGEGNPAATGEDGFQSMAIAMACLESANTGKTITMRDFLKSRS